MTGLFLLFVLAYFVPAIVASLRGHHNATPIFILNLFLGWSFIGWVIALVWSFTRVIKPEHQAPYVGPGEIWRRRLEVFDRLHELEKKWILPVNRRQPSDPLELKNLPIRVEKRRFRSQEENR